MGDADKEKLAEERTEWAEERTEWAEDRTRWADQRTYLAQQRTFAGWIRTGLASIAVGFGVLEFMREAEPAWLISILGFVFITIGAIIEAVAFVSFRDVSREIEKHPRLEMNIPVWWAAVITGGLIATAAGGLIYVFI